MRVAADSPAATSRRRRLLLVTLGLGLGLTVAGCSSGPAAEETTPSSSPAPSTRPSPTPTPTPSASATVTPTDDVAASIAPTTAPTDDEQTGVAAAVARYYQVYNWIAQDPSVDPLQISAVALDPEKDRAYTQLTATRQAGQRQVGDIVATVETVLPLAGTTTYLADVCVDTRGADVLDSQGQSLWAPFDPRQTYSVFHVERRGADFYVTQIDHDAEPCGSAAGGPASS